MRDYLSISNFKAALPLGMLATVMSAPRILEAGRALGRSDIGLALYVPAALCAMTLMAGAATAWGHCAGMHGAFPDRKRRFVGVAAGIGAAAVLTPLRILWFDPILRDALLRAGDIGLLNLHYPPTPDAAVALLLWAAGFQTLFLHAGAMSFLARITGRKWAAVGLVVVLAMFICRLQIASAGVEEAGPVFLGVAAAVNLIAAILFSEGGLPAAMSFAAALNLHLLAENLMPFGLDAG